MTTSITRPSNSDPTRTSKDRRRGGKPKTTTTTSTISNLSDTIITITSSHLSRRLSVDEGDGGTVPRCLYFSLYSASLLHVFFSFCFFSSPPRRHADVILHNHFFLLLGSEQETGRRDRA